MAGKFVSPKVKESLMTDILVKLFVKDYKVLNFERGNADELHGNLQSMA